MFRHHRSLRQPRKKRRGLVLLPVGELVRLHREQQEKSRTGAPPHPTPRP